MLIPEQPIPTAIPAVSPSLYETLLGCPARAAWYANGPRNVTVAHPSALLGTCFHGVMEALQKGQIQDADDDDRRDAARRLFDQLATQLHSTAHTLIRVKFSRPEKIPYYNLMRERAAAVAGSQRTNSSGAGAGAVLSERRFQSADGVIVGRPDVIEVDRGEVIDYKTGQPTASDSLRVSDRESRQLTLYAYLALEAGVSVTRGTIVRSNGDSASIEISEQAARAEAERARVALAEFNSSVADGRSFSELARPSAPVCRFCPCIPFCEPFWDAADPSWSEECGCHVEGTVRSVEPANVQGTDLVTIEINVSRGTVADGIASIEQIPLAWVEADGDRCPRPEDTVRLVDARLVAEEPAVVRADRVMTSPWRLGDAD